MKCDLAKTWLFKLLDDELADSEKEQLESHLAGCASCRKEWGILTLPRRIANALPVPEPSPFFCRRLMAGLSSGPQAATVWQMLLQLSKQVVPGLAAVTLVLISLFGYQLLHEPDVDIYQAYDGIFMPSDRQERMIIADHDEFTDDLVLRALAGQEPIRIPDFTRETPGKK